MRRRLVLEEPPAEVGEPRPVVGVGLFVAALITGQLGGGVVIDQFGAFGAATRQIDAVRILGVGVLLVGVVLVRGFR